ncbi:MAG: DUF4340 domain-containing protein [Oligoflexia bacterium]|nr:DUF4340 domain-containing protein [Oligoflexia bacterium]
MFSKNLITIKKIKNPINPTYMKHFIKTNKSACLLFILVLIVICFSLVSEIFQSPKIVSTNKAINFVNPLLDDNFTSNISEIEITNRLGNFKFERTGVGPITSPNAFALTSPKKIAANSLLLTTIISELKSLTIKKSYIKDQINWVNFSLDTPSLKIVFISTNTNNVTKKITFNMGVINTIDSNTYVNFSDQDLIFQTNILKIPLESFGSADFIDSKLISSKESSSSKQTN